MSSILLLGSSLASLLVSLAVSPAFAAAEDSTLALAAALANVEPMSWVRAQVTEETVEGRFLEATSTSLLLRVDVFDNRELQLDSISKLSLSKGSHSSQGVMIGAVAGVFAGIIFGALLPALSGGFSTGNPNAETLIVTANLGAIVGAAIGGVIGSGHEIWGQVWP